MNKNLIQIYRLIQNLSKRTSILWSNLNYAIHFKEKSELMLFNT